MKRREFLLLIPLTIVMGSIYAEGGMSINPNAVGNNGINFIKRLDDETDGYIRALRNGSQADFDTLSLVVFMNQTANIERKLDILINELHKNNELLAAQSKLSARLLSNLSSLKSK